MQISVIIPSYNRRYFLHAALDSVFQQTFAAAEVIVVDDGSEDGTQSDITQHFPQVHYIYQHNRGVSAARNRGIAEAKYDWIAFLDSDDLWRHNKLEAQVRALNENPQVKICHSNETWLRNGQPLKQLSKHKKRGGYIFAHCLPLCVISPSSVLMHRSLFDEFGGFDTTLAACEDYDMWLRICAYYPVLFLDQPLIIKQGGHQDQLSKKYWGMDRFRIYALDKILQDPNLAPKERRLASDMLVNKVQVYLKGALKRQRQAEVLEYERLLQEYQQNP